MKGLRWMFDSTSPLYIAPRPDLSLLMWLLRFSRACTPRALERNMELTGRLSRASIGLYERIAEAHGLEFDFVTGGYMEASITEDGFAHARMAGEMSSSIGVRAETLDRAALHEREPALAPSAIGAVLYPESGYCNPGRLVDGLGDVVRDMGVVMRLGESVDALEQHAGRVIGARLSGGETLEADATVLAAGVWSRPLAAGVGVHLPIQPAKGYNQDIDHPDPPLTTGCVFNDVGMACTPMGGFLRLAGTLEFSGLNDRVSAQRLDQLIVGARRYLSHLNGVRPRSTWMGMRPCTPDGMPVIGWADRAPGLFVATGHAMLGLTFGAVTGLMTAQAIAGEALEVPLEGFEVERF